MFTLSYTKNGAPKRHPLGPGETLVGRSPECGLVIDDVSISKRHAVFEVADRHCVLRDLGSRCTTSRTPSMRKRIVTSDSIGSMWMSLAPCLMASPSIEFERRTIGASSDALIKSCFVS